MSSCKHGDFYSQLVGSFCLQMKKSLKIKKIIAKQMLLRLHSEQSFCVRDRKFLLLGLNDC